MGEHVEAGGVDEVDFGVLPLGECDGVLHGGAAGDFFLVVNGDGGAIFNAALGGGHLGGMQQSGDQGGLAAVRMPDYSYVADLTSLVRFHVSPCFGLGLLGAEHPGPKVRTWAPKFAACCFAGAWWGRCG